METRLLHFLVEDAQATVDEKTRQNNRLTDCLKLYFPQILRWFDDVTVPWWGICWNAGRAWSNCSERIPARCASSSTSTTAEARRSIQERIAAIYQATAGDQDAAVLEACALTARGLVALLATLRDNIDEFDQRIARTGGGPPRRGAVRSLPGAGAVLVPRLIVAFGTRRDRYDSAYEMQCYSGIAPVKEASGNSQWVHFRFACPKFLRQTFHEFAVHSIANRSGPRLLRPPARRQEQVASGGGPIPGVQMDSHHLSLLEGRQTL